MAKIISIGSEQFLKGITTIPYYEGLGIIDSATNVDFWRNPGLISAGYTSTDIGGADVTNIPKWIFNYPARSRVYVVGAGGSLDSPATSGKIYAFNMASDTLTDTVHSNVGATAIRGALLLNDNLFYTYGNYIGRAYVNTYPALWYDTWQGNAWTYSGTHPIIKGPDNNAYVLDGRSIDRITIVSTASSTYTTDALNNMLPFGMVGLCGVSDGNYLVIGMSSRVYGLSGIDYADYNSSIVFWDTFSPSFNKKYDFAGGPVRKLVMKGGNILAFVGDNIYQCSYDSEPQLYLSSKTVENMTTQADSEANSVDVADGQLLWGGRNKRDIWSLGSPLPQFNSILSSPHRVPAGENIACVKRITKDKIYVGTDANKLYAFKTSTSSYVKRTIPVSLGGFFSITSAKVNFQTGGQATVSIQNSDKTNILSQTIDGSRKSQRITRKGTVSPIVDRVIFRVESRTATIKSIDLFGTPVDEEYAE